MSNNEEKKTEKEPVTEDTLNKLKGLEKEKEAEDTERLLISNIIGQVDNELAKCEQKLKCRDRISPCLPLLNILCSNNDAIGISKNTIIHNNNENKWETLIIKKILKEGIFRITFKRRGNSPVVFGIIKPRSGCPSSGTNISDRDEAIGLTVEDTIGTKVLNFFKNETTFEIVVASAASMLSGSFIVAPFGLGYGAGKGIRLKRKLMNEIDFNTTIRNKEGKEISGCVRIEDKDDVIIEINLLSNDPSERTMHYFVNDVQSPVIISGLPNELYFAISLYKKDSKVEFISMQELEQPYTVLYEKMVQLQWMKSVESP